MKLFLRDTSIKCKKIRKNNLATGTLKRSTSVIPISIKGTDIDKYILEYGFNKIMDVEFGEEKLRVKIIGTKKDVLLHNIINIDFQEL